MVYESSYDSGRRPFKPDTERGTWASPSDFIMAGLGLAFKLDIFSINWTFLYDLGWVGMIPYGLALAAYIVPIMIIQCFMGQFSSSGFISVFRIAPIFKGMGYIALAINLVMVTYYCLFVAVPLLFWFNSFRPSLPWSCENHANWVNYLSEQEEANFCNMTLWTDDLSKPIATTTTTTTTALPPALHTGTTEIDIEPKYNSTEMEYVFYRLPSVIFFKRQFGDNIGNVFSYGKENDFSISWTLLVCIILTWLMVAGIFSKFFNTEKLGKLLRYGIITTLVLLLICVFRLALLPGAFQVLWHFIYPKASYHEMIADLLSVPLIAITAFGSGWGCILSLASFNKFKTNIVRSSWIICCGQFVIFLLFSLAAGMTEKHFDHISEENYYTYVEHHWVLPLMTGTAFASMPWPNMWCIIFYTMLIMASLIVIVTQLYSVFVTIFDEFEFLRPHKMEVIFGTIGILASLSLYYATNQGVNFFTAFSVDSLFTQIILDLLLLWVILWIYGRERLQRDIEFMLGQCYATWKINMLRFVAPVGLLFTMLLAAILIAEEHIFADWFVHVIALIFIALPYLFVPGYMIFILLQTSGSLKQRFQRCCRPNDWYPVDAEERQRYEESMANTDITHQLNEVTEDVY